MGNALGKCRARRWALSAVALALLGGCGASRSGQRLNDGASEVQSDAGVRVVVSIVFDQLGSNTLSRLLPYLDDEGGV